MYPLPLAATQLPGLTSARYELAAAQTTLVEIVSDWPPGKKDVNSVVFGGA